MTGAGSVPDPRKWTRRQLAENTGEDAEVSASAPALMADSADTGYLSSQTSSMRQPLVMLLTMIVNPSHRAASSCHPRL